MEEVTIVGVDLAKRVFQLHGAAADGTVVFRKKLSRAQFLPFLAAQPACTVAMAAEIVDSVPTTGTGMPSTSNSTSRPARQAPTTSSPASGSRRSSRTRCSTCDPAPTTSTRWLYRPWRRPRYSIIRATYRPTRSSARPSGSTMATKPRATSSLKA